jgi:hypothetical protein
VLTPGRLNLHESELVAVQTRATDITGSFDPTGKFISAPKGSSEVDFEQDLIASVRVLSRGQLSVTVPLVETYRRSPSLGADGRVSSIVDTGGGVGDIQVNARWDATLTGASRFIPGVAVLASLTMPTGVPPELATHPLGSDATGAGMVQGALGLSLEQTFGDALVNLTGSATLHTSRDIDGVHTLLGPSFNAFAAVGYSFAPLPVVAVTVSYTGALDTQTDGVASSGRTQLRFGLSTGYAFNDSWRIQGGVFGDPPAAHFGQGQPSGAGLSATVFRTW